MAFCKWQASDTVQQEVGVRASLDSHILTIRKGYLDGKIFSVVVFRPIKKNDFIIKMVTVDLYLILVRGKAATLGFYGRM